MGEAKFGDEFVTHEFDEAIAVQRAIVKGGRQLAKSHPHAESRDAIAAVLKDDKATLASLEKLGKAHGATGKVEDVAEGIIDLLEKTLESADEAPSEAYEAHAVLLSAKRKQQDSAGGVLRIARALKDDEMKAAAAAMAQVQKSGSDTLADALAMFAAVIATAASNEEAARSLA